MEKREIKFRVWDSESKCYRDGDWCLRVQSGIVTGKYGEEFPEFMVEQYTGIKDKNGKEIYEGDIIGWEYYFDGEPTKEAGLVEWDVSGWTFNDGRRPTFCEREIIGNIFENKDLLNETN